MFSKKKKNYVMQETVAEYIKDIYSVCPADEDVDVHFNDDLNYATCKFVIVTNKVTFTIEVNQEILPYCFDVDILVLDENLVPIDEESLIGFELLSASTDFDELKKDEGFLKYFKTLPAGCYQFYKFHTPTQDFYIQVFAN